MTTPGSIDLLGIAKSEKKILEPVLKIKFTEDDIVSLHTASQAVTLMAERKLTFNAIESIGDAFPELYPVTVRNRLGMQYGVPSTTVGALVQGRDNVDYFTMVKFAEAIDFDKDICDMMVNPKNRTLHREILDLGLPMICLLGKK